MFRSAIKKYLHLPNFFDEDKERTANFLRILLFFILLVSILVMLISIFNNWLPTLRLISAVFILTLLSITVLHFGHLKLTSFITVLYLTFALSYSAYIGDGIHDIGVIAFPVVIIVASMLFGTRLFVVFSALPILILGLISLARYYDKRLVIHESENLWEFTVFSLVLAVTAVGIRMINLYELKHLNRAKQEKF
jgi:hypothetical protein